jgi:hypothetical protein
MAAQDGADEPRQLQDEVDQQALLEQQMLQQQMMQQQDAQDNPEGGRHYFDSIETDKFEMPTVFPVDILLADNQVGMTF